MVVHSNEIQVSQGKDAGVCMLVHGGAWDIPDEACADHLDGLRAALQRGRALLVQGRAALEVVTETVAVLESHGAFDAGCGSVLNRDGEVELDAGAMEGLTLRYGSVAGIKHFENPIRIANRLLLLGEGQVYFLSGIEAERFAEDQGFSRLEKEQLISDRETKRHQQIQAEMKRYHTSHSFLPSLRRGPKGTVGCVALDRTGTTASATSTGGTPFKMPGRIGDSPLPGAGFYADEHGAASATGWGEAITAIQLSVRTIDRLRMGMSPRQAVEEGLRQMSDGIKNREGIGARGGIIVLDAGGRGAWAYTTPRMARGGWREGHDLWVEI